MPSEQDGWDAYNELRRRAEETQTATAWGQAANAAMTRTEHHFCRAKAIKARKGETANAGS